MSDTRCVQLELKEQTEFFCPVCGTEINDPLGCCEHILFFFDRFGEFCYTTEKMRPYTKMWEDDEFCDELDEMRIGIMDYLEEKMPKTAILFGFADPDDFWYVCVDFEREQ